MRTEEFIEWMIADGLREDAARSRLANCQTVENFQHVDLDGQYDHDRCEHLRVLFTYTTDDERAGRAPLHQVPINGNIRNGSATYRAAIKKYVTFRDSENGVVALPQHRNRRPRRGAGGNRAMPNRESYSEFLDAFGIRPEALCDFGLDHSVFAESEEAWTQWQDLKNTLLHGGRLYIRAIAGNAHDREFLFYKRLHENMFPGVELCHDCTGNYYPRRNLSRAVGWDVTIHPAQENGVLVNFQTSHALSGRTHNPLLYLAVWNIVFTPKVIDPFTGDEAETAAAALFREAFLDKIRRRFDRCVADYNNFVDEHNILNRIGEFRDDYFVADELARFKEAALRQWANV